MAWIKRNLYFVITVVVALGVTGYCGYLLYSTLNQNAEASDKYATSKNSLEELEKKSPYPSPENIKAAEADATRVRDFFAEFRKPFSSFPTPPKMDVQGFNTYLIKTIALFGAEATNAGVGMEPNYAFSFSQQVGKINHPIECIDPWLQEIEEIRAILHLLYGAKINYLERIKRVAVSQDDMGVDDYVQFSNKTNTWGTVAPYVVNFRAFSAEIANVLAAIASSSNCFIVKAIYVSPSRVPLPTPAAEQAAPPPQMERPIYRPRPSSDEFQNPRQRRREGDYGGEMRPRYAPPQPVQAAAPSVPAGPETVLFEKPLFVTLYLDVVKLKPAEKPPAEAPKPSGRRGR